MESFGRGEKTLVREAQIPGKKSPEKIKYEHYTGQGVGNGWKLFDFLQKNVATSL